ncbi:MAG: ribokinase [Gammaproteobacteria bacterium]|nr:ribokinase [Gammaproteobacteria bacterium]
MKVINFGSLNIDHVYQLDRFVKPGETLASSDYQRFVGGKGCNQSIALSRAGATVMHAGRIGSDGMELKNYLAQCGVDVSLIKIDPGPTGHAIIQVTRNGENSILLHGGANQRVIPADVDEAMALASSDDLILVQNEISNIPYILNSAAERGLRIVFNPAPMNPGVHDYPLDKVDCFILNEHEGRELSNQGSGSNELVLKNLSERYSDSEIILTLGAKGVWYQRAGQRVNVPGRAVDVVDTTAAGDTFVGYFLAGTIAGSQTRESLQLGCEAASLCVQQPGAADSIPDSDQLQDNSAQP